MTKSTSSLVSNVIRKYPSLPSSLQRAVTKFPITGNVRADTRFLFIAGFLESSYSSPSLNHPGSSARGFFGLTKAAISDVARMVGVPYSDSIPIQAQYAAAYFCWLRDRMSVNPSLVRLYSKDKRMNTFLNVRARYVSGLGTRYLNHPHARAAVRKLSPYLPYISGDPSSSRDTSLSCQVQFMAPRLRSEFQSLPHAVKRAFHMLVGLVKSGNCFVTSVRSSYTGSLRTPENGPNHYKGRAIDLVITPFSQPMFLDQEGKPRSPHFNWNQALISVLSKTEWPAAVVLESDHIHIDDTHPPGLYTYSSHRSSYHNDDIAGCGITLNNLTRIS